MTQTDHQMPIPTEVLMDRLIGFAMTQPDKVAVIYESEKGAPESTTYGALIDRSRKIARALQDRGCEGRPVGLLFPTGIPFVLALLGCFFAGAIAVPLAPVGRRKFRAANILKVIDDADIALTLVDTHEHMKATVVSDLITSGATVVPLDQCEAPDPTPVDGHTHLYDKTAVLQYTSGSTGTPAGVMVSHRNINANQHMIQRSFGHDNKSDFVGWAPHYHDQGLFGNIIQPLFLGAKCVLIAPTTFLRRPLFWLESIARNKAFTSGGPNFAYDLCVQALDKQPDWSADLSCWQNAFNGAEPIRSETLRKFAKTFARFGFDPSAELPCYGLAECTLLASAVRSHDIAGNTHQADRKLLANGTFVPARRARADAVSMVSCGRPVPQSRIVICDPDNGGPQLPDGTVGEVYIAGDHISVGYWKNAVKTAETFGVSVPGQAGDFLRTGDLGFMYNGELFVVARKKDMVIVRGRNIFPADVENICRKAHPAIAENAIAAFSGSGAGLSLALELNRSSYAHADQEDIEKLLRVLVLETISVTLDRIYFFRPGGIPRTTSGKVMRRQTKELAATEHVNRSKEVQKT